MFVLLCIIVYYLFDLCCLNFVVCSSLVFLFVACFLYFRVECPIIFIMVHSVREGGGVTARLLRHYGLLHAPLLSNGNFGLESGKNERVEVWWIGAWCA